MMQVSDANVADIVTGYPKTADIFREKGIDFCCGGNIPLSQAAEESEYDKGEIVSMIEKIIQSRDDSVNVLIDTTHLSVAGLIEYIQNKYHKPLADEMAALSPYITEVSQSHGGRNSYLIELNDLYKKLKMHLIEHTVEEDRRIFPSLVQFADDQLSVPCNEVEEMLQELIGEHKETDSILRRMRTLTDGFTPSENACGTYRMVYGRLEKLEQDTFNHIYMENNILFSKVKAMT